jgi:hypothetical protein
MLIGVLSAMLLAPVARGDEPRLSISGYDPVAYFTDGKPVPGKSEFEYLWHRLRWRFASGEHRDLFVKDPDRYTPQYDGYCAMGVGANTADEAHKDTPDPEAWAIVDGKLYFTHNQYWLQVWRENAAEHIRQGRTRLGSRQEFAGTGDRRTALRRFAADDPSLAARRRALGQRRRAGGAG